MWFIMLRTTMSFRLPGGTGLLVFLGAGAVLLIASYVISKGGKNKAAK